MIVVRFIFFLMALVILVAAGTFDYWQAWIYILVGAATSILLTLYITKDPKLRENGTEAGPAELNSDPRKNHSVVHGIAACRRIDRSCA